ncbi:uncharacterized protein LOC134263121, partial [Saccostrea cucullata]|uniref:uncharacterized protein LOC134263121 n=1 Tax=Saccostrea cuccullata TaxID=36930 RepID=UPI002ED3BB1B
CWAGTFGDGCTETCPPNKYGIFCVEDCNCTAFEICDGAKGCINAGRRTSKPFEVDVSFTSFRHTTEGNTVTYSSQQFNILYVWIPITGVLFLAIVSCGVIGWTRYYKIRQRHSNQGPYSQPLPRDVELISVPEQERYEQLMDNNRPDFKRMQKIKNIQQQIRSEEEYLEPLTSNDGYISIEEEPCEPNEDRYEKPEEQKQDNYLQPVSDGYTVVTTDLQSVDNLESTKKNYRDQRKKANSNRLPQDVEEFMRTCTSSIFSVIYALPLEDVDLSIIGPRMKTPLSTSRKMKEEDPPITNRVPFVTQSLGRNAHLSHLSVPVLVIGTFPHIFQ